MASGACLDAAAAPFVLTLEMDGESFARLNALRRSFYPPARNMVPAHVTLFHQLPGERSREIKALLRSVAGRQKPIDVGVSAAKNFGRGVALPLIAPRLSALRAMLAAEWLPWLTDQDRAGFRPHVTLQNKVTAGEASAAERSIATELRPFTLQGVGLHLWRYRGGPWEDVQLFRFR